MQLRKIATVVALTLSLISAACSGAPSIEEQLADTKADLEFMGFKLTSWPVYESAEAAAAAAAKKAASKKPAKKWNPLTGQLETPPPKKPSDKDPAELEATFKIDGCNVEADRRVGETDSQKVRGQKIEFYSLEVEDEKIDLLIAGAGAHTPDQARTMVKRAIEALPAAERPSCYKP